MPNHRTPDLTGQRFGRLQVLSQSVELRGGRRQSVCHCRCDCGNAYDVPAYRLQKADGALPRNPTRSCGCSRDHGDLTGRRFERLTVLREAERKASGDRQWICSCQCGGSIVATSSQLINGGVKSCGCLLRERQHGFGALAEQGSARSHTPQSNAKRTDTAFGPVGSAKRKRRGEMLRESLASSGAVVGKANVAKLAAAEPAAQNPYRGVCWNKSKGRWMAYCQVAKRRWSRLFRSPEEAKEARDKKLEEMLIESGLAESVDTRRKCKKG